ncbi:hypothetical protein BAY1663_01479 [Pseudomonas sp. BAY1663]|jgi:hypothetical protein|nr:hypothetical protein [Pseudomonas sp. BAY1663]EXF46098.1 hypothetical protein BAY1663_01479 [Pseudomonas sp. BAY1663]
MLLNDWSQVFSQNEKAGAGLARNNPQMREAGHGCGAPAAMSTLPAH